MKAALSLVILLAATLAAPTLAQLRVSVSIPPQTWLVKAIGGDHVEVTALLAPGDSPATYQPTDSQVTALMRSDLFIRIGVPFERAPWFDALGATKGVILDQRLGVDTISIEPDGRGRSSAATDDPHIWLSPTRLLVQADTVAAALARLDPLHRRDYEAGVSALRTTLTALDDELREQLAPYRGRTFLVFHPSWGYLAHDYGLRQGAVERAGKEPSDAELTALQETARRERIRVVFVQPQITGHSARAIAGAIGGTTETLDPLATDIPHNLRRVAARLVASFEP